MRFDAQEPHRCGEFGACHGKHEFRRCVGCEPKTRETQPLTWKLQPGVVDGPYKRSGKGVAHWLKGLLS
jgi:hypothetical protein